MYSTLITVTLFVSLAIQSAFAGFAINTPPLSKCNPVKISWEHAVAPYIIEIVSASDPCGGALKTITGLTSTILHYTSELNAGSEVVLFIADSAGNEAWSGNITVGGGSSGACEPDSSSTPVPSTPGANRPIPLATPSNSASPVPSGLAGAINANSGGVHRASTPLLFTALAALLALTV